VFGGRFFPGRHALKNRRACGGSQNKV
jgi:hypothetical protein